MCGPCQLPQQRWKRMRSCGRPFSAWFNASILGSVNLRYSSKVGSGLIWSKFSAIAGSSICRTSPASTIALYSSRMASAQANTNSSSLL